LTATLAGNVSLAGYLGDGKAFNQFVPVSKNGNIPLYASLYSRQGLLLGWLSLTNNPPISRHKHLLGTQPVVDQTFQRVRHIVCEWLYQYEHHGARLALRSTFVGCGHFVLTNGTLTISRDLASALVYAPEHRGQHKLSTMTRGIQPTSSRSQSIPPMGR